MKTKDRIQEIINEANIDEEEEKKSLKQIVKEHYLRSIVTKRGLIHLLTLQDIELKETKENNKYLRKEKKKYKDLCVELDKKMKTYEIENKQLIRKVKDYEKRISKK